MSESRGAREASALHFAAVPGATAYPIAGTTWLLVYAEQKDHAKGEKLVQFLRWAYSDGEKLAPSLDYAPLPDNVLKRALDRVNSIKY